MSVQKLKPASPDPSRETLRKAIAERNVAKDACARADLAERAGLELLAAAEKKLEAFGDLDESIVQHRAERIKDAARGGPVADLKLPDELVKRRAARDEARELVAANKAAHTSLVTELEAAQKALQRAEHRVSEAAGAILTAEANRLAAGLQTAWGMAWFLYDVLSGLPARLPRDAVDVCQQLGQHDFRQFAGGKNLAVAKAAEDWRTWMAELCENPDAQPLKFDDGAPSTVVDRVA